MRELQKQIEADLKAFRKNLDGFMRDVWEVEDLMIRMDATFRQVESDLEILEGLLREQSGD